MSLGKGLKLATRADFLALSAFELGLFPPSASSRRLVE